MSVRAAAILVLLSSLTLYVLHESAVVVAPVFVSLLLAYALEPAVDVLMRLRLPRIGAAMIVYLLLGVLTGSLAGTTSRQVDAFLRDLPGAIAEGRRMLAEVNSSRSSSLDRVRQAAGEIDRALQSPAVPPRGVVRVTPVAPPFDVGDYLQRAGTTALVAGGNALLIAVLAFLMICAGDVYKHKLVAIGGTRFAERKLTLQVIHAIDRQIQRYLLVRLLISAIVGVATGGGLWLIGVNHAVVWGVVAGALNVLPFIGPTAAVALITFAAFVQFKHAEPTLLAGAWSTIVAALEGNVLTPALMSRTGDVNTVAVFLSVLFWGWLWGFWGLVLAIPIMVAIKAATDHIEPLQPVSELLGR